MMVVAAFVALWLKNALQAFQILLQIGAGTGLLFILRWFWWRVNALSELVAMVVSFMVACYFQFVHAIVLPDFVLHDWQKLTIGVCITTVCWMLTTFLSSPTEYKTLCDFCTLVNPGGPGWKRIYERAEADGEPITSTSQTVNIPRGILCMVLGCVGVYSALFATGFWMYGRTVEATILTMAAVSSTAALFILCIKTNAAHTAPIGE